MPVVVLAIRVWIHSSDEVFASCAELAGLLLDLLHPSSVSCNTFFSFQAVASFSMYATFGLHLHSNGFISESNIATESPGVKT